MQHNSSYLLHIRVHPLLLKKSFYALIQHVSVADTTANLCPQKRSITGTELTAKRSLSPARDSFLLLIFTPTPF